MYADRTELAAALTSVDVVELGQRMRAARVAQGLTQSEASQGVISTGYLSRIEAGTRRPDMKVLLALAPRLGTTAHELLLGISSESLSHRRVQLDWVELALRTGDAAEALEQTTAMFDDVPLGTEVHRRLLCVHALALEACGDYAGAARHLETLFSDNEEGLDRPRLTALTALSRCYRHAGELQRAIAVGTRALGRVVQLGLEGSSEAVKLTLTVAAAHAEFGDITYASVLCQQALVHADALASANDRAGCYWNASIIESRRGNHVDAVHLAQKALFILDEDESPRNTAGLRTQLGLLHLRLSPPQTEVSLAHLRQAEQEMLVSDANPADMVDNRLGQARALFLQGDLDTAEAGAAACLEPAASAPLASAQARTLLGQIAFRRENQPEAVRHYEAAILALSSAGADRGAAQLWFELGGLWMSVGRTVEALDAFQRAGASTGLQLPQAEQADQTEMLRAP